MRYEDIPKKFTWSSDAFTLHRAPIGPLVIDIDDMLEKYHQAHTQMARKNLLADLEKSVSALKAAFTRPNPALNALLDVVKRKMKFGDFIRKYDNVVCVSYSVTTGSFEVGIVKYQGKTDDKLDMLERVRKMKSAVNQARGFVPPALLNDSKTLKLFMAPEFYFRGRYGAYAPDIVSQIMPLMRAGSDGTARNEFKDWLFVFGTAISAAVDARQYCFTCKSAKDVSFNPHPTAAGKTIAVCSKGAGHNVQEGIYGATIDNVALIQKGQTDYLVAKEFKSGIDFRNTGAGDFVLIKGEMLRARHDLTTSKFQDERMGGGIFNIDGITFGMEICLDHLEDRLAGASNLQVMLIPSAGMTIENQKTIAGGVTFNVDGLRSDGAVAVRGGAVPGFINHTLAGGDPGRIKVFNSVPLPYV